MIDATTGLIYVGNGQYYDPETGRLLTRGVNPNGTNPYVPFNPIGVMLGPLALVSIYYSRKKGKKSPWIAFLFLGLFLAGCSLCPQSVGTQVGEPETSTTNEPSGPATEQPVIPESTEAVVESPATATPTPCCNTPTPSPMPTPTPAPTLMPPPTNPTEAEMIEYIQSFGITLVGNWTGDYLTTLWKTLFTDIGYLNLKNWLGGQQSTMKIAGTAICSSSPSCYSGETPGTTIYFYGTNMVNPVANMLHEIGHLVDNLWNDYFTLQLEKTAFTLGDAYLAGWNNTNSAYASLPSSGINSVRLIALKSDKIDGQDAWQQRGGTPHWEDWADIFSNAMAGNGNINSSSDLGSQLDTFFRRMENHVGGGTP